MKQAYKLLLIFLLFCLSSLACEFNSEKDVMLFSGPIAHLVKEMGILNQVKAISLYTGIDEKNFKGEIIKGGIFVSPQVFKDDKKKYLVIYDKSSSLERTFAQFNHIEPVEFDSRLMTPFEVVEKGLKLLKKHTNSCEKTISQIQKKYNEIKSELLIVSKKQIPALFFLGKINNKGALPELLMVNDGVVKFLTKHKILETYKSDLAYVPWSQKRIKAHERLESIKIGMSSGDSSIQSKINEDKRVINISGKNLLIPGPGQVELLVHLKSILEKSHWWK